MHVVVKCSLSLEFERRDTEVYLESEIPLLIVEAVLNGTCICAKEVPASFFKFWYYEKC
jgi:hypothetical protein